MRNALVADVSHTLIMTYHNNANQPCAVAWTILNMYVTVSLLFNSCHLNATEIVSVIAVKFKDVINMALDCIKGEPRMYRCICFPSKKKKKSL